jgi:hypothetical protein
MLGFVAWVATGVIAQLAGLGGQDTAVPMALLMIACTVLSAADLAPARPGESGAALYRIDDRRLYRVVGVTASSDLVARCPPARMGGIRRTGVLPGATPVRDDPFGRKGASADSSMVIWLFISSSRRRRPD